VGETDMYPERERRWGRERDRDREREMREREREDGEKRRGGRRKERVKGLDVQRFGHFPFASDCLMDWWA
jgi:hypothetical protein